jgi:predicted MPP superfamily phosphohydrolase
VAERVRERPSATAKRFDLRRLASRPDLRRLSWRLSVVVLAFVGAALGLAVAGSVTRSVGPVHARFSLRPSASMQGGTSINIPPLGSLRLATDRAPVQLNATVTDIDTKAAQRLINNPDLIKGIEKRVTRDVNTAVAELLVRATLAALIGAAVLTFVVTRRWRAAVVGAVVVLVAGLASAGGAYATWNSNALAEPQFTGLLSRAPTMVGDVQDIVNRFGKYSTELAKLVTNVSKLYAVTSTLPSFAPTSNDTIKVLHISDVHDNPEAWSVIASISRQFDIDFVIDTGDLSDHGTSAENAIADDIGSLGMPYVYIKGNHDSDLTVAAVRAEHNAIVLNYSAATVDGLRIYGAPDPRFTPDITTADTNNDEQAILRDGTHLADLVKAAIPPRIDMVLVHDPVEGRPLDGVVPLVLAGHTHKRTIDQLKHGTLLYIEGSTGGAGLRALDHDQPTPLQASVLYFSRTTHKLQAYDEITLGGLGLTSVSVERHVVSKPIPSPSPSAPTSPGGSPGSGGSGPASPAASGP